MFIHIALLLALAETLGLALVLLHWADRVPGARLLVGFLLGVAVWIVGNELPTWTGPIAEPPALMLLATAAVTSAVFLHFALAFYRIAVGRPALALIYGIGIVAALASIVLPPGRFEAVAGLDSVAVPNAVGWGTSLVWTGLAGCGQLVLLRSLIRSSGLERRQVAAVTVSSAWGLFCMSGDGLPALGLPYYPWSHRHRQGTRRPRAARHQPPRPWALRADPLRRAVSRVARSELFGRSPPGSGPRSRSFYW